MKSSPLIDGLLGSFRKWGLGGTRAGRRQVSHARPRFLRGPDLVDRLETRLALSAATLAQPPVTMLGVATADSQSLTIDYRVSVLAGTNTDQPLTFGLYRSADATFDSSDVAVPGTGLIQLAVDDIGSPAAWVGTHRVTIKLPAGLPIDTAHPYVLAVANPQGPSASTDPTQAASFRKYTIGVVTHGGNQAKSWKKNGPAWQLQVGSQMKWQGYDAVIPYNWVSESSTPGSAVKQGPRLANLIERATQDFHTSEPVDLHFVGHSEGAVVNMIAMNRLEAAGTPQIMTGYVEASLLDPHSANNAVPGRDFSSKGSLLGGIASSTIKKYQGRAKDPQVTIPAMVDNAQVFYQHTMAETTGATYNLWGQVPIANAGPETHYYNLGAMNVTHSGKKGVTSWYLNFVSPDFSKQNSLLDELKLDGTLATESSSTTTAGRVERTIVGNQATFSGTSTPGASVRLYLGPTAKPSTIGLVDRTTADSSGRWSITTKALAQGSYRAVIMSSSDEFRTRPGLAIVPMAILGEFRVGTNA